MRLAKIGTLNRLADIGKGNLTSYGPDLGKQVLLTPLLAFVHLIFLLGTVESLPEILSSQPHARFVWRGE